jgi:hypothetical protein
MNQPKRIKIVIKKINTNNIIEKPNFIDKDLEFDAPKKINLKNLENYDRNELEKWFEEDHSNINENLYAKKKKRKFSEFKKEFKLENEKINLKRKFSLKIRDEFLTKKLNDENFNKENIHSKKEIKKETHNFNDINNNVNSYLENNEKIIKEEKEDNEINNNNVENNEKNNNNNNDNKIIFDNYLKIKNNIFSKSNTKKSNSIEKKFVRLNTTNVYFNMNNNINKIILKNKKTIIKNEQKLSKFIEPLKKK